MLTPLNNSYISDNSQFVFWTTLTDLVAIHWLLVNLGPVYNRGPSRKYMGFEGRWAGKAKSVLTPRLQGGWDGKGQSARTMQVLQKVRT